MTGHDLTYAKGVDLFEYNILGAFAYWQAKEFSEGLYTKVNKYKI